MSICTMVWDEADTKVAIEFDKWKKTQKDTPLYKEDLSDLFEEIMSAPYE